MENIIWHQTSVSRRDRNQSNGHRSAVIWFTGLSGSGKSTIAHALEKSLFDKGANAYVLDGDNVRHGLSANLGFSEKDRKENIRRIGEVAKLMTEAGVIAITAFISPFAKDRDSIRALLPEGEFIEIYCDADLKTCEDRDVKGLYKKARQGLIKNYTGIDSPYEPPTNPELTIDTSLESIDTSVERVINLLISKSIIG